MLKLVCATLLLVGLATANLDYIWQGVDIGVKEAQCAFVSSRNGITCRYRQESEPDTAQIDALECPAEYFGFGSGSTSQIDKFVLSKLDNIASFGIKTRSLDSPVQDLVIDVYPRDIGQDEYKSFKSKVDDEINIKTYKLVANTKATAKNLKGILVGAVNKTECFSGLAHFVLNSSVKTRLGKVENIGDVEISADIYTEAGIKELTDRNA